MIEKNLIEKIEKELFRDERNGDDFIEYEDIENVLKDNFGEDIVWNRVDSDVLSEDYCDWVEDLEILSENVSEKLESGMNIKDVCMINVKGVGLYNGSYFDYCEKVLVYIFE